MFETEQTGNWVETRQNCLVTNSVHSTTRTRQDSFVLVRVGSVNKLRVTYIDSV